MRSGLGATRAAFREIDLCIAFDAMPSRKSKLTCAVAFAASLAFASSVSAAPKVTRVASASRASTATRARIFSPSPEAPPPEADHDDELALQLVGHLERFAARLFDDHGPAEHVERRRHAENLLAVGGEFQRDGSFVAPTMNQLHQRMVLQIVTASHTRFLIRVSMRDELAF